MSDEREHLQSILEILGAGSWNWNFQTGKICYDEAWARALGYTLEELQDRPDEIWAGLTHPEDLPRTQDLLAAHLAGTTPSFHSEVRMRHSGGSWVWMTNRGRVVHRDEGGRPTRMLGTHVNASAIKRQEAMLRKSEALLLRASEVSGFGVWEIDLVEKTLHWSAQVKRLLRLPPSFQPTFEHVLSIYEPATQKLVSEAARRAMRAGGSMDLEVPVVLGDGVQGWFRLVATAEYESGKPARLMGTLQDITQRVEQRKAVERATERLAAATQGGGVAIWEYDLASREIRLDALGCSFFGFEGNSVAIPVEKWIQWVHVDDRPALRQAGLQAHTEPALDVAFRVFGRDGKLRYLRATARLSPDPETGIARFVGATWDVTPLRELGAQIADQNELLRVTLNSIGDAVLTTDRERRLTWMNPVAERLTGWALVEAKGLPLHEVFRLVDEETRQPGESPVDRCLSEGKTIRSARRSALIARSGEEHGIEDTAAPIRNVAGELLGVVLVFRDVTDARRLVAEMSYRARHDALTGLVNRAEFEVRLRRVLAQTEDDRADHVLLFIDLDQFKIVNDSCGHTIGDKVLKDVGALLADSVRAGDTVARLGGDEFAVILERCNAIQGQIVAQKICDRMDSFRYNHNGRRFRFGASIGLVPLDTRWNSPVAAMQAADSACYDAKEGGRNRVHVWFESDQAMLMRNGETQWAMRVEQALDDDRFALFAQRIERVKPDPEVPCGVHAEVLVRMVDLDGSLIPPGAFLPAAERFHLASRLDRWVLRHTILRLRTLSDHSRISMLSVNLSGKSIGDRSFHHMALEKLKDAGPAVCRCLCIEITETAAITNLTDAASFIKEVRRLGVRVALDDFGAGAASFGYLRSLTVDILKIDGQFIKTLLDDTLANAAVRCFVDVAHVMGLQTVAEFVDKRDVLTRLGEIGVDFAQGFLLHKPEPIDQVLAQLIVPASPEKSAALISS